MPASSTNGRTTHGLLVDAGAAGGPSDLRFTPLASTGGGSSAREESTSAAVSTDAADRARGGASLETAGGAGDAVTAVVDPSAEAKFEGGDVLRSRTLEAT